MSAASIFFALLIALFLILMLYRMGRLKPQIAGGQSQRMCPELRTDHVSVKGKLLGVWQALHGGQVLDFKEMVAPFVHVFLERIKR